VNAAIFVVAGWQFLPVKLIAANGLYISRSAWRLATDFWMSPLFLRYIILKNTKYFPSKK